MRILVIEDEVKLAAHLSRALEHDGHEVRVVHDGKVALVEARDGNYDLLVLDVELPRMDGFEILKIFFLMIRPPPRSTLSPYTTLFRPGCCHHRRPGS